jgi:hypothetical protein
MKYEKSIKWLIDYSEDCFNKRNECFGLDAGDSDAEKLINDLETHSHAFVLGCLMDRQIPAERAWVIPYKISQLLDGDFSMETLCSKPKEWYENAFKENNLHRFNGQMAEIFYLGVHRIQNQYGGVASRIWSDAPGSETLLNRFMEFKGAGMAVSRMAVDLLYRLYKVPMADASVLDVSPSLPLMTVFKRYGLIPKGAGEEDAVEAARRLYPKYPGIFDEPCWSVGSEFCHSDAPDCKGCPFSNQCPKL